ncbi:hypothetical protein F4553_004431 [Allocatelliglobosispora scoriae]|uniref:PASTA domain-containing protein n=1 Tax=Allocatelliglobosispora scoriae TaxID=643052 RepID=A0A841BWA8_9ACTN|nr:hypothetical protein [Allocatelliglobosispora scoriae]MBB5871052.1 hypothetical protein [Allocatelliglobosispora scoriae]
MSDPWDTRVEPAPPKQGISPGMIAAIAVSVLVLSIAGATGGWLLAGSDDPSPNASGTQGTSPSAQASLSPSPSPSPSAAPSPTAAASPTPGSSGGGANFALPAPGTDPFQNYFQQLRALKLGVEVYFGEQGQEGQVVRSVPEAGKDVHAGITVKIYVAGAAPTTTLPYVINRTCRDLTKNYLTAVGLRAVYIGLQAGVVVQQNPDPTQGGTARWNDKVEVRCGPVGQATGSPSP